MLTNNKEYITKYLTALDKKKGKYQDEKIQISPTLPTKRPNLKENLLKTYKRLSSEQIEFQTPVPAENIDKSVTQIDIKFVTEFSADTKTCSLNDKQNLGILTLSKNYSAFEIQQIPEENTCTEKQVAKNDGNLEPKKLEKLFEESDLSSKTTQSESGDESSTQKNTFEEIKMQSQIESTFCIEAKKIIDYNDHYFRSLIFTPEVQPKIFKKHLFQTFNGIVYANKSIKNPPQELINQKSINLPTIQEGKKKTVFFDLDETLIHTMKLSENPKPDAVIRVNDNGLEQQIAINIRPYCHKLLKQISEMYEIYAFTASTRKYAEIIMKVLDPKRKYFAGAFSKQNCLETKNGQFLKDLRVAKNRDLKNIVIVDNLAQSFSFQIDNGVPILEFYDDKNDQELMYLSKYLLELAQEDDVRVMNKRKFKLAELAEHTNKSLGLITKNNINNQ